MKLVDRLWGDIFLLCFASGLLGFTFAAVSSDGTSSLREWIGATSGWGATLAALVAAKAAWKIGQKQLLENRNLPFKVRKLDLLHEIQKLTAPIEQIELYKEWNSDLLKIIENYGERAQELPDFEGLGNEICACAQQPDPEILLSLSEGLNSPEVRARMIKAATIIEQTNKERSKFSEILKYKVSSKEYNEIVINIESGSRSIRACLDAANSAIQERVATIHAEIDAIDAILDSPV